VKLITAWLVLSATFYLTSLIVPGFSVKGIWGILKVSALFGILNVLLGPIIFNAIGIGTLGLGYTLLFSFLARVVTNALLLKLADVISDSLTINGFRTALLGALVMSGIGTLLERFVI
jgi:putative membrane protein